MIAPASVGGGRKDVFEPERDIYWGAEEKWVEAAETRIQPDRELEPALSQLKAWAQQWLREDAAAAASR